MTNIKQLAVFFLIISLIMIFKIELAQAKTSESRGSATKGKKAKTGKSHKSGSSSKKHH